MIRDITIGQYYQTKSVIHELDPRVKLMGTLVFIISLFLGKSVWMYLAVTAFLAAIIKLSNVPLKFIVKGLKAVLILIIFSAAFNLFLTDGEVVVRLWKLKITKEGIYQAVFMVIRLMYLIMGSSLMTLTTTPNNLTDGLEKSLGFLKVIKQKESVLGELFYLLSVWKHIRYLFSLSSRIYPLSFRTGYW